MNNLAFDIKINSFIKKLNGLFIYKEMLSGGETTLEHKSLVRWFSILPSCLSPSPPPEKAEQKSPGGIIL